MVISMKKNTTTTIISTHKHENLYFAVAYSKKGKIIRTTLPKRDINDAINEISTNYPHFILSDEHSKTAKKLSMMFHGEVVDFDMDSLDLTPPENSGSTITTPFEWKVILEVAKIPKGEVKTYKDIAKSLNCKAYRAVGTAIGKNPFPIVIPCHRVIRSDGKIGGFRGGSKMKEEILKNEGKNIRNSRIME